MPLGLIALSLIAPLTPVQEASPFVGTGGHGHTFPGATAPFGMVQLSPDTRTDTWDGCSGYHYTDSRILGFSHTHLSGTGIGCMGDIMVMPYRGAASQDANVSSAFSHAKELAQPGYYSVYLDDAKTKVELTATPRVGFHHYTFEGTGDRSIVLDLNHSVQNDTQATYLHKDDATTYSGWRRSGGWGGTRTVYFVMKLSQPAEAFGLTGDESSTTRKFFLKVGANDVKVKVGISATGIEGARKNLAKEAPGWDFDAVRKSTQKVWNTTLGATTIEAKDPKVRRTFYSNLYLSYQAPNLFSDADGSYFGHDHKIHTGAKFQNYSTFSLWDTYRSLHPLLTLLQPDRVDDMMQSLVAETEEGNHGTTPIWPLWGNESYVMIGIHSISAICEAYLKGYRGFDVDKAYAQMKSALLADRNGLDNYRNLGFVASRRGMEATSKTIEYGYNDWCMAKMAEKMGKTEDAALFYKRSTNYRNLWDGSTQLFRGRKADGTWRKPFDQLGLVGDEYTESDAWQYAMAAQQDPYSLIGLYGGDQKFVNRLDTMLTMTSDVHTGIPDITGRIGQYAHGNEPCHHVLYLYNYAGAPAKGAKVVRQVMRDLYNDTPEGQVGNVDCGQMSAWYVWSAMGVYPVNPASGVYAIGSPVADKVTMRVGKKTFTVVAVDNSPSNLYVQSATFNGKPWTKNWISDEAIRAGGVLTLKMGPRPSAWGTSVASRPPSTMPAGFKYAALPTPADDKPELLSLPIRVVAGNDEPVGNFIPDPNILEGSTNGTRGRVDVSGPDAGPEGIYLTERYGKDFSHRFPVPAGSYTVKLHFAEVFEDAPGQRIENISINGKRVLTNFDPVVAAGGPFKAVVRVFKNITPDAQGNIVVRIQAAPGSPDENAKISAIEILP